MRRRVLSSALAAALMVTAGCENVEDDDFATRVRATQSVIVPATAEVIDRSPITRTTMSASAAWTIRTSLDWHGYATSLEGRLPGFRKTEAAPALLRFTQQEAGDTYVVEIHQLDVGPPLIVKVTLVGFAD